MGSKSIRALATLAASLAAVVALTAAPAHAYSEGQCKYVDTGSSPDPGLCVTVTYTYAENGQNVIILSTRYALMTDEFTVFNSAYDIDTRYKQPDGDVMYSKLNWSMDLADSPYTDSTDVRIRTPNAVVTVFATLNVVGDDVRKGFTFDIT